MSTSIKKIIAVLNNFSMINEILEKSFYFARKESATIEILYVHESPLFDIPDFFLSQEENTIDKEKVKKSILEKLNEFDDKKDFAVFVKVDDTEDRVWSLAREDKEILVITGYNENIVTKLLHKIRQPLLILKTDIKNYQKIFVIVNGATSASCIQKAITLFSQNSLELCYDYRYVVMPETENSLQNLKIIEDIQRENFEKLKKKTNLEGKFFVDGDFLAKELNLYLEEKDETLLYLCVNNDNYSILESVNRDVFVASRY